jgi:L-lactate dehydrogenase
MIDTDTAPAGKIGIVGTGFVGSTFAYTLVLSGLVSEIVLIDRKKDKARGEEMDLSHAVPFAQPVRVRSGGYEDLEGTAIVCVAAGVGQRPGEDRLSLLRRNVDVLKTVVTGIVEHAPGAVILVASNPVDILSWAAWRLSGLPSGRVIGSGTILDTARLRFMLSEHYGVDPRSVHAHIIGEHGDSEVPVWSLANIAGIRLEDCEGFDPTVHQRIFEQVRDAAYEIIRRKGATYYAIAVGLTRIVGSILRDEHSVLSVSTLVDGYLGVRGVYLGVPAVVGRAGVERVIELPLDETETAGFRRSAGILKETGDSLGL